MTIRVAIAYPFHDRDWLGGRNYFASLFRAIEAAEPGAVRLMLVTGARTETSLPDEFPFLEVVRTPLLDRMHPFWLARQADLRLLNTDRLLARFMRKHGVDVLSHSFHLGSRPGVKTLAWLYDFQFVHVPEYWEAAQIQWGRQLYNAVCRNCDAIVVSSDDAMKDLETFAPWCTAAKYVLHFVSNPIDFARVPARRDLLEKYSLPEDYFYLPNQFWTAKNHRLAIDALAELRRSGAAATIVCTGRTYDGRRPKYFDELMDHCAKAGVAPDFKVLGVVPYTDTQALMAYARAVINPSRFEGWSTTVEEAITLQKTLLLSDIPVHREQASALGRFFAPDDPAALARLMQQCLAEKKKDPSPDAVVADHAARLKEFGRTYLRILESTCGPVAPVSNRAQ